MDVVRTPARYWLQEMGKDKSRKGSKSKHRSKDKKRHKKEKKSKHHGRSSSPSSDSSDGGRLDVTKRLHMGRAAARATREILAHDYGLRKELRQVRTAAAAGHWLGS